MTDGASGAAETAIPEQLGPYEVLEALTGVDGWERYLGTAGAELVQLTVLHFDPAKAALGTRELARAMRQLSSVSGDHVVRTFRAERAPEGTLLVTQHLAGRGLREVLVGVERLDRGVAMRLLLDAARGLQSVHESSAPHGDVRPSNLLLGDDGVARVASLGIGAVAQLIVLPEAVRQTRLAYRPPEEQRGRMASIAGDLYSFGALIHELLIGKPPPPASPTGVTASVTFEELEAAGLPNAFARFVVRLMSPTPSARPTSVRVLLESLEEASAAIPPSPREAVAALVRSAKSIPPGVRSEALEHPELSAPVPTIEVPPAEVPKLPAAVPPPIPTDSVRKTMATPLPLRRPVAVAAGRLPLPGPRPKSLKPTLEMAAPKVPAPATPLARVQLTKAVAKTEAPAPAAAAPTPTEAPAAVEAGATTTEAAAAAPAPAAASTPASPEASAAAEASATAAIAAKALAAAEAAASTAAPASPAAAESAPEGEGAWISVDESALAAVEIQGLSAAVASAGPETPSAGATPSPGSGADAPFPIAEAPTPITTSQAAVSAPPVHAAPPAPTRGQRPSHERRGGIPTWALFLLMLLLGGALGAYFGLRKRETPPPRSRQRSSEHAQPAPRPPAPRPAEPDLPPLLPEEPDQREAAPVPPAPEPPPDEAPPDEPPPDEAPTKVAEPPPPTPVRPPVHPTKTTPRPTKTTPRPTKTAAPAGRGGTLQVACPSRCDVRVDGAPSAAAAGAGVRVREGSHTVVVTDRASGTSRTLRVFVPNGVTVKRRVSF